MDTIAQIAQELQEILNERADALAKETHFIRRQRKLTGADFSQTMILGWLGEPEITLDGLTQVAQHREVTISASGLNQRFTQEAATLLQRLLEELTAKGLQAEADVPIPLLRQFSAVLIEDSSTITLLEELASIWRGCGGNRGTCNSALKLFVRWEVLKGRLDGPALTTGRHSDNRSPLSIDDLPDGSLYLADLGFFSLVRFLQIQGQGRRTRRYLSTRWQPGVILSNRRGHRLNVRACLPEQVGQRVEMGVQVGARMSLTMRLLAERVPEEVAKERQQRLREAAADQGREASEEVLSLANWSIILTNVPRRMLNFDEVLIIMRLRWQIERLFRLWKEHGRIDEWRSKKPWRILCEVYAKLAAMVIQQWLILAGSWQDPHRSIVKAAQVVRRESNRIMVALYRGGLEQELRDILRCMRSGCQLSTRQQQPTTSQFLLGMPLIWEAAQSKRRQKKEEKKALRGRKVATMT